MDWKALRCSIASSYDRSMWFRALVTLVVVLVFLGGCLALFLAFSPGLQPVTMLVWLILVACSATWVLTP